MRYVLVLLALVVRPLAAQEPPRWEYGILAVANLGAGVGVPGLWSAGDSSVDMGPLSRTAARAAPKGKTLDGLVFVMNALGEQGWELISVAPQMFIFRRRKTS